MAIRELPQLPASLSLAPCLHLWGKGKSVSVRPAYIHESSSGHQTHTEQQAQQIRDSWDPVKQKLRELEELKQARELDEVTVAYGLERWLASVKADSDSGNEHTHSKY